MPGLPVRLGGAPAHAMIMRSEDVTITKGSAKEHWTLSAKGNRIARCGTPLFAKNERHPEFLLIKVLRDRGYAGEVLTPRA